MPLLSVFVLLWFQLSVQCIGAQEYMIESSQSIWNTVLSIREVGLFYNIWISDLHAPILHAQKWHTSDAGIILATTYNATISYAYPNATITDISADYAFSQSRDLHILLVLSYIADTPQHTMEFVQVFKFNEHFAVENESIVGASYYLRPDYIRPINEGRVNILSDHNNRTFHVLWLVMARPADITTEYQSFDPCSVDEAIPCQNTQSHHNHLYAITYNVSSMRLVSSEWILLTSTPTDTLPEYVASVSLYGSTNQSATAVACTSTAMSLQCYFQQNHQYEIARTLNDNMLSVPTELQLSWVEGRNNERGLFLLYPHENTLLAEIRLFDGVGNMAFVIANDSSVHSLVNPVDTSLVDSKYVLVAWSVLGVGVFLNAFDIDGQPFLCTDFPVYMTTQNITSLHVSSTYKSAIITFVSDTLDGKENAITNRIVDYRSDLLPYTQCSDTVSSSSHNDGHVWETTTAAPCLYVATLSFRGIANNDTLYATKRGQVQLLQAVTDALTMIGASYSAQFESSSVSNTTGINQTKYEYSITVRLCIADEISYNRLINQLLANQTVLIGRLEQHTALQNIHDMQVLQDPDLMDDQGMDLDLLAKYGVFGAIGIGLCVIICCLALFFAYRRNSQPAISRQHRANAATQDTLETRKILQAPKHRAIPSNTYSNDNDPDDDVEMAALPEETPHSARKLPSAPSPLLRIDTLDRAAQKSLPPSRSLNESLYDNQILTQNSASFNYQDEEATNPDSSAIKTIPRLQANAVHMTAGHGAVISEEDESSVGTQLHDGNANSSVLSPKPIPRVKTFVTEDTDVDPYEHLDKKT